MPLPGEQSQAMVRNPRVAVVIPCFNDGDLIRDAIASVTQQEPCELVVVDDGSTAPTTVAVLESLRADGITVITQANAGLGPARMTGVRNTAARFVHPLDADDLLPPGALTRLADTLDQFGGAGFAWGSYRTFGASDCVHPAAPELDPWRITYFNELVGTCMIRRTTLDRFGGWENTAYEDWDLWMRYAECGVIGIGVPDVTLLYRQHHEPRLLARTLVDHDVHWSTFTERHARLLAARARNRAASPSPRSLKLLLPAIDAVPRLSARRKWQLWAFARYLAQPERCSSCYRGPLRRLRDRLTSRARFPRAAARVR